ncbi:hypothetical protein DYQ86_11355 [Acidobacteria bacterium AB60]|nr:hypothetical protein DYQ86_11355 [Acidobacteria bacterium AB60]
MRLVFLASADFNPLPERSLAAVIQSAVPAAFELLRHRKKAPERAPGSSLNSMRWLMIVLLVSMVALLAASAGLAHHIWQEHRKRGHAGHPFGRADDVDIETEEAP